MKNSRREPVASLNALNTSDSMNAINSKTSLNPHKFWDVIRYQNHGVFEINIPQKLRFSFLTSIFPYSSESLLLSFENFHLTYQANFQLTCQKIMVKRCPRAPEEGHLVNIPKVEVLLYLKWISNNDDPSNHFTSVIDNEQNLISSTLSFSCF